MHARVVVVVAALLSAPLYAQQPAPSFIKPYPGQKYYSDPIVRDFDEIWVPAAKVNRGGLQEGVRLRAQGVWREHRHGRWLARRAEAVGDQ